MSQADQQRSGTVVGSVVQIESPSVLPCAHCGSRSGCSGTETAGYTAWCTECGVMTRVYATRGEAVAVWNRRAELEEIHLGRWLKSIPPGWHVTSELEVGKISGEVTL